MPKDVYVSITGLKVRRAWQLPRFWYHTVRSLLQARAAPGNILVDARRIDGVHHTLTVWTDQAAMRAFLTAGAHLRAMRRSPQLGTGKVVGYAAEEVPDWPRAHAIWVERGRVV